MNFDQEQATILGENLLGTWTSSGVLRARRDPGVLSYAFFQNFGPDYEPEPPWVWWVVLMPRKGADLIASLYPDARRRGPDGLRIHVARCDAPTPLPAKVARVVHEHAAGRLAIQWSHGPPDAIWPRWDGSC